MQYTDHPHTPGKERHRKSLIDLTGSPLASAGIQARNFTTAIYTPEHGIAPEFYTSDSLSADIERLCDPSQPMADEQYLNVAVKYFLPMCMKVRMVRKLTTTR